MNRGNFRLTRDVSGSRFTFDLTGWRTEIEGVLTSEGLCLTLVIG